MSFDELLLKLKKLKSESISNSLYNVSILYKNRWFYLEEEQGNIKISTEINHEILGEICIEKSFSTCNREEAYEKFYKFVTGNLEKDLYIY